MERGGLKSKGTTEGFKTRKIGRVMSTINAMLDILGLDQACPSFQKVGAYCSWWQTWKGTIIQMIEKHVTLLSYYLIDGDTDTDDIV